MSNLMIQPIAHIHGKVIHGLKRGRKLGFPTANVNIKDIDPTLKEKIEECYIHNTFDFDFYDEILSIILLKHIRPMVAFSGIDALISQIQTDTKYTDNYIQNEIKVNILDKNHQTYLNKLFIR
ncbi:hypothetical protein A3Q56_04548 [Intoshia linei]|uniref:riboflavin kinase n=1 Tax=Intoshia linei TaxID=1819745 RepID=A0A177B260_9BILA|nr:hypothetical protein A3Q56_04548 [Intoshia linei]